jgi:hypothetical protein
MKNAPSRQGDTLTFGDQMFSWKDLDTVAGDYLVAFIAEDLYGNAYPTFTLAPVR